MDSLCLVIHGRGDIVLPYCFLPAATPSFRQRENWPGDLLFWRRHVLSNPCVRVDEGMVLSISGFWGGIWGLQCVSAVSYSGRTRDKLSRTSWSIRQDRGRRLSIARKWPAVEGRKNASFVATRMMFFTPLSRSTPGNRRGCRKANESTGMGM